MKVRFTEAGFDHAFFKEHPRTTARTVWQPDRAQRLLWLGLAVERPTVVCHSAVAARRYNLFCRVRNDEWPWYLVVIEQISEGTAVFVTAFPIGHDRYKKLVRNGDKIEL